MFGPLEESPFYGQTWAIWREDAQSGTPAQYVYHSYGAIVWTRKRAVISASR